MMSRRTDGKPRVLRVALAVGIVAGLAVAIPQAGAAEQCISAQAKKNLAECPTGKFQADIKKKRQVSFSSAPEPPTKKKRDVTKPVNPTDIAKTAQRDERRVRLKARSRRLLITEIANVEQLYRSTPRRSVDRPQLMRRLAEGYVELESAAFRDKIENQEAARKWKKKNPKKAARYRKEASKAGKVLKLARKNAIKYYQKLKKQYPKWCQFPNAKPGQRGCTDEVLYYLAYEYEQAGNLSKARDVYLELIDNWKNSRFIPNAYLAFGELFFNEAQADSAKWSLAKQAYENVIKYPPPANKLWGYAHYKLAYVFWNTEKFDKAIDEFKKVIDFGTKYSQLPNAAGLADSARRDIIPVYALAGDPGKAYGFFKPLSGDKGGSDKKTFKMMEDLGQTLIDTGHYPETIILYQDLKKRNRGHRTCFYEAQITKSTLASQSGNKPPQVAQLKNQLAVYKQFKTQKHPHKAALRCANDTAALLTETAMAWHLEAVGSGGVRGTGDKQTMSYSEELYELVVNNFTAGDFKAFKFPRIVKEDWPTIPKIRYAMADLLYFQKKWAKCGPAFDAVVAEDPKGRNAAEAAFASVLCYQNVYAEQHKDGSHRRGAGHMPTSAERKREEAKGKYEPKPFNDQQKGMIKAFNRYICYIKPPAQPKNQDERNALEQYVEVKYARARTYFEAQHWEESAEAFRDVAINHHEQDAAVYAAHLYLESINVLASKIDSPRTSCYDNMEQDVPKFIELFCTGKKKDDNEEHCDVLFRIQRDIERLKAEELIRQCDEGGASAIKKCEEGAQLYMAIWKKYGKEPCQESESAKKLHPSCHRMDEVLYNAARAYQAARLIAKAIAVRTILINPDYHLDQTEAARKAVYEIGGNYQAIAVYDLAAEWYERYAKAPLARCKKDPCPDGATALSDAVVLRLGLGQHDRAMADARLFNGKYGMRKPAEASKIAFAIAAHYVHREDWRNAERQLSRAMRQIESKGDLDVKIQARAMMGHIYAKMDRTAQADRYYRQVIDAWKNPGAQVAELNKLGGSDEQKLRRVAKVLTAVGEALYHFAEKKRVAAEAIEFPEYTGSGERDEVQKFIEEKVKKWMEKKAPAIREAEEAYLKIVELKPSPPPKWVIAAGSAVGTLWGRYVAEFRAAPYPKGWDQPGDSPFGEPGNPDAPPLLWSEIRAHYLASLDGASEKEKQKAKAAYTTCLSYSVKYEYFDKHSRSCEEWLSKQYPGEFHLIDEFRGSPTRVNSGLDERAQALEMDGSPITEDTRAAEAKAEEAAKGKEDKK